MADPIYVTKPYLPPLAELIPLLEGIWERRILSNSGPLHRELEARLCAFLGVDHISLMNNGMIALSAAMEAAGVRGDVITTPYSFVATSHAVRLEQLNPVFVDIRAEDLNIDPAAVEAAITPRTRAIMAVHVYGNPCDVEALQRIADRHGLALIYDAAHAFGVTYRGRGLLSYGDFATLSFHATKAFNTFEGGAVIAASAAGKGRIDSYRNFGIADEVNIPAVGTNGKMSEFNAAVGLLQLDHFNHIRTQRRRVDQIYREGLAGIEGVEPLAIPPGTEPNFSYFPILVRPSYPLDRDGLYEALRSADIHSRRYFYPLLSSLPMYRDLPSAAPGALPVATRAAEQILCLPIYPDLPEAEQQRVIHAIRAAPASRQG